MQQDSPDVARFMTRVKVEPDGCWLWQGAKVGIGYGQFGVRVDGKLHNKRAHRWIYEVMVGPIPKGLVLRHRCDNPSCVNPSHLEPGTPKQNSADMVRRARAATGRRNGAYTHPERRPRGDRNGRRLHPERYPQGDDHYSRREPERLSRGDAHYSRRHPELRPRGEQHGCAKLTNHQVHVIRALYANGSSQRQLAGHFEVSQATIGSIVRRETWRHVE